MVTGTECKNVSSAAKSIPMVGVMVVVEEVNTAEGDPDVVAAEPPQCRDFCLHGAYRL